MTPADEITQAAQTLREAANEATPGPWKRTRDPLGHHVENGDGQGRVVFRASGDRGDGSGVPDSAYIALMDPAVGTALADWLDMARFCIKQRVWEPDSVYGKHALAVAHAINGGGQ